MIIRCTAKLLKETGTSGKSSVVENTISTLGDWHANLFYLDRKKNVIFCNDKTLYCVVAFQVNREQIKDLEGLLRRELGKTLIEDGLEGKLIQKLVEEVKDVSFAPTNSRSVVGVMVYHLKNMPWFILDKEDGWSDKNLKNTVKRLNRTPMVAPNYIYAIDFLGQLLGVKIDHQMK